MEESVCVCVCGGGGGDRQWVGAELTYTGNIRVCGRAGRAGIMSLIQILRSLPMNFPTTSRTETAECLD